MVKKMEEEEEEDGWAWSWRLRPGSSGSAPPLKAGRQARGEEEVERHV